MATLTLPSRRGGKVASVRVQLIATSAAAALVAVVSRPHHVPDDAALTFRYAERLATGRGFTFNDHEHVFGASNGLYTLLLSALRWLGIDLNAAALVLGVVCFVATVAVAVWLARSLAGPSAGWIAASLLLLAHPFRGNALSGMEAGLSSLLALGTVALLRRGEERWAGVVLGLALFNKLDAAVLALVVVGVLTWRRRRLPLEVVVPAALVVLPYLVFCQWWFGQVLPQSALGKVTGTADDPSFTSFDRLWVARSLLGLLPCVLAAAAGVWHVTRRHGAHPEVTGSDPPDACVVDAVAVMAAWPLLYATVVSLVPLGAPWPWYLTPLVPPIVVLASVGASSSWISLRADGGTRAMRVVHVGVVAAVAVSITFYAQSAVRGLTAEPTSADRWQRNVRAAAGWMAEHVPPGEVVDAQCWGYPAYRLSGNPVVDPCRLNSLEPAGEPTWRTGRAADETRAARDGFCPVRRFGAPGDAESVLIFTRGQCPA